MKTPHFERVENSDTVIATINLAELTETLDFLKSIYRLDPSIPEMYSDNYLAKIAMNIEMHEKMVKRMVEEERCICLFFQHKGLELKLVDGYARLIACMESLVLKWVDPTKLKIKITIMNEKLVDAIRETFSTPTEKENC